MKRLICLFIIFILLLSTYVSAEEFRTQTGLQTETDLGIPPLEDEDRLDKGPRYNRIRRGIAREYHAGGLTRTEYIQRKRELDALYK